LLPHNIVARHTCTVGVAVVEGPQPIWPEPYS
jgi:hypothetical protein